MAKNTSEGAVKSKKRFRLIMFLCLPFAIFFKMSFIFFFIGMVPALVAWTVDNDRNKYTFSTVAALNFAGVFPYMMDILLHGGNFRAIEAKLSDAIVWFVMYGAAALGWVLVWSSPVIAAAALEGLYKGRIMHLENMQKKAIEEWGTEIMGREEPENRGE